MSRSIHESVSPCMHVSSTCVQVSFPCPPIVQMRLSLKIHKSQQLFFHTYRLVSYDWVQTLPNAAPMYLLGECRPGQGRDVYPGGSERLAIAGNFRPLVGRSGGGGLDSLWDDKGRVEGTITKGSTTNRWHNWELCSSFCDCDFVVAKSSGQELVIIARCYQISISPPQVTQKATWCWASLLYLSLADKKAVSKWWCGSVSIPDKGKCSSKILEMQVFEPHPKDTLQRRWSRAPPKFSHQ